MREFGPPGPGPGRDDPGRLLRRQYAALLTERTQVEAQIVRGQFAAGRLASQLETTRRALERSRTEALSRDEELRARYAALSADSEVIRALAAINQTSRPEVTLTLGPREDYTKDLRAPAASRPDPRQPVEIPRGRLELKGTSRLVGLAGAAEAVQDDLGIALGRLQALERDAESRRKMLEKTPSEKQRAEQNQVEVRIHEALERVASTREEYLQIVAAFHDALAAPLPPDDSRVRHEIMTSGPVEKGAALPIFSTDQLARRLKDLERVIHSEKVPVDRDRAILWVEATLNGKPGQPMIVDPASTSTSAGAETCLSARVAAAVGVRPAAGEPPLTFTTADGRTIPARRARLASLQLGPWVVRELECLVLSEDYGETPSRLGGRLMKRFAIKVDKDANLLELTQVQVKPITRAGRTTAGKPAGSIKGKKTATAP
jgi:hypothetical protein